MPAPAIAASTQSKTKLKAFQFTGHADETHETTRPSNSSGKENSIALPKADDRTSFPVPKSSQHGSQGLLNEGRAAYPATPVGRVPLAELIYNGDDSSDHVPLLTPVERVLWDHSPSSTSLTDNLVTPIAKRGTKRARSSSPTSSPRDEPTRPRGTPGRQPSLDLQALNKSLTSAHADPARDLWSRYSLNPSGKDIPRKSSEISPSNPLHSSSPQTPARHLRNDHSGLRRTLSCGVEWPTSAAKRRKIQQSHCQNVDKVFTMSLGECSNHPGDLKISKVNFLLEKIHDRLSDHTQRSREPSSSLPIVLAGQVRTTSLHASHVPRLEAQAVDTPRQAHKMCDVSNLEQEYSPGTMGFSSKLPSSGIENKPSSDYGGDEFDEDIFEEVDTTVQDTGSPVAIASTSGHHVAEYNVGPNEHPQLSRSQISTFEQLAPNFNADSTSNADPIIQATDGHDTSSGTRLKTEEDEFGGEVEDELFETGLVDIAAKYDQRVVPENNTNRSTRDEPETAWKPDGGARNVRDENGGPISAASHDPKVVDLLSEDEFGAGFDFDEIAEDYAHATQRKKGLSSLNSRTLSTIQRYLIVTVVEGQYVTDKGHSRPEKVLLVLEEKSKINKVVILRQSWFDSSCSPGSYVHVLGDFNKNAQCIIDDAHHILILHPDHLISATVVADSFSCTRRAVLQDRVKATNESNEPQVYGHILHEIFQDALKANRWDTEWLVSTIKAIASRYLETLFELNVDVAKAVDHLTSRVPELQSWAEVFVSARPRVDATVKDRNGVRALMSINKLLDVEEHVWSPMYGLKGNVDATVQVIMKDGEEERTLTVPLELKTGRNNSNAAHKAQTALYTLLLSDRYDIQIAYGILYYMETSEVSRIPAIRHELRHMIIQRNELACYVRRRLELPPMLKSPHLCGRCYAKTSCFIYHKLVDDGDGESSGMKEKFDELVKHLSPVHGEFFKKWDDLLTKEEADVFKFRRELWTMLSSEREKVGRCFGNVVIEPGSAVELADAPKINRFRYIFIKQKVLPGFSFTDSQIIIGEPIVISDELGHFALANGYVTHVRKDRITVAVDRRLHNARLRGNDFDAETNQTFTGIMEVVQDDKHSSTMTPKESEEPIIYRLDKDEFSNGMATVRNNLIRIMEKDLFGAHALRRLVVECVAPTFIPNAPVAFHTASQSSLNVDQRNAITKVMSARDYALVLGMPGTGKTTTIAHIIRALAARGKSILLTSYTHTAVDNILLKIRNDGIGILRLGGVAKVHLEVQGFADLAGVPKTTVEELKRAYSSQVVATTCLGINHPIFNQRVFDYCIVDEASQITLPVCLGPIRMARTFILVGDHYQLPPLVQNKEAQEGGLDISLFKLLSERHPSSVVSLEHQYRMCEDIMCLSNTLIYDGRLKCGTSAIASSEMVAPNMAGLGGHHYVSSTLPPTASTFCAAPTLGTCWIRDLLDPAVKVAFVNTDPILPLSREIAKGSRITNPIEAALTTQLVESLLTIGVHATEIGVITLYRSQLALLKQSLRQKSSAIGKVHGDAINAVEMHTADKFQGRDKEVIVLSLVRSNESGNVGDLLKDWRRVNVALTRARTKLLILGSWDTMRKGSELLAKFCQLISERSWKVDLARNALEMHQFEDAATPGSIKVNENDTIGAESIPSQQERQQAFKVEVVGKKVPEKRGKTGVRVLLGNRPVMRDIFNEIIT
ncbi:Tripartite DNA replication factor [Lambiella insularis]|nr:Tripartite DNA replication factor [Lambiella insularis]